MKNLYGDFMTEVKELQKQCTETIDICDRNMKHEHDIDTTIIHFLEELGELARIIFNDKIGRDILDKNKLAEELADIFILLSHLANQYDVDLEKAVEDKCNTLKKRCGEV